MSRVLHKNQSVLLTDFAAAYPSAKYSWIFSVIENTGLPGFLCRFLKKIIGTASHTWNLREQKEDNCLWPEEYDKVVLRVVLFCNGL